jgi:hypothetical protein
MFAMNTVRGADHDMDTDGNKGLGAGTIGNNGLGAGGTIGNNGLGAGTIEQELDTGAFFKALRLAMQD